MIYKPETNLEIAKKFNSKFEIESFVHQEMKCLHNRKDICFILSTNGKKHFYYFCKNCGEKMQPQQKHEYVEVFYDLNKINEYDDKIKTYFNECIQNRIKVLTEKWEELRNQEYRNYLTTYAWADKRAKVLQRAKFTCEGCGTNPATQVHHLHYRRIYKEMLFDLVAVCEQCHQQIHES